MLSPVGCFISGFLIDSDRLLRRAREIHSIRRLGGYRQRARVGGGSLAGVRTDRWERSNLYGLSQWRLESRLRDAVGFGRFPLLLGGVNVRFDAQVDVFDC